MDPTMIAPNEFPAATIRRSAVDTCKAFALKYIGSESTATVAIANTTGDIAFVAGGAADTTVNPGGGTPGTIDLSADAATFALIQTIVDASPNWEYIPLCARPEDASEASGTSKIINNISATSATIDGGYVVKIDTSAALYHSVEVTKNGQSSDPHGFDAGWFHQIELIRATTTFGSGTSTIQVYSVEDRAQTSTLLTTFAAGATTVEAKHPADGNPYPLVSAEGRRLIVKVLNSAAMTAADLAVSYRSYQFGPGIRKAKLRAHL